MSDKLVLIVVAVLAILAGTAAQRWLAVPAGWQGPEAAFPDLSGSSVRLSDQSSAVLVLNFWASWCEPCREEMPVFDRLYAEFKPSGLRVVGIALEEREAVAAFLQKVPVSYPILIGERGGDALAARLGNHGGGLPFTVVFGANGQVLAARAGPQTREGLLADIEPLLGHSR
ncbi:MAG: TlpA disulfide reductase family protein [Methylococcus sp.]|nr:TlpA disulfide reductase family protein [Methylococcus sp.]